MNPSRRQSGRSERFEVVGFGSGGLPGSRCNLAGNRLELAELGDAFDAMRIDRVRGIGDLENQARLPFFHIYNQGATKRFISITLHGCYSLGFGVVGSSKAAVHPIETKPFEQCTSSLFSDIASRLDNGVGPRQLFELTQKARRGILFSELRSSILNRRSGRYLFSREVLKAVKE